MTFEILCNLCSEDSQEPLTKPGALVFGIPDKFGRVAKFHACEKCWDEKLVPLLYKVDLKNRRKGERRVPGSKGYWGRGPGRNGGDRRKT